MPNARNMPNLRMAQERGLPPCQAHDKVIYASRKIARRAADRIYPGQHMSAYLCDAQQGWHIGHLPRHIRAGEVGREVIKNQRVNRSNE